MGSSCLIARLFRSSRFAVLLFRYVGFFSGLPTVPLAVFFFPLATTTSSCASSVSSVSRSTSSVSDSLLKQRNHSLKLPATFPVWILFGFLGWKFLSVFFSQERVWWSNASVNYYCDHKSGTSKYLEILILLVSAHLPIGTKIYQEI